MALGTYKGPTETGQGDVIDIKKLEGTELLTKDKDIIKDLNERAEDQIGDFSDWIQSHSGKDFDDYTESANAMNEMKGEVEGLTRLSEELQQKITEELKKLEFTLTPKGIDALLKTEGATPAQKQGAMKAYVIGLQQRLNDPDGDNKAQYLQQVQSACAASVVLEMNGREVSLSAATLNLPNNDATISRIELNDQNKITKISFVSESQGDDDFEDVHEVLVEDQTPLVQDGDENNEQEPSQQEETQQEENDSHPQEDTGNQNNNGNDDVADDCEECNEEEEQEEEQEEDEVVDENEDEGPCPEGNCDEVDVLEFAPPIKTQYLPEYDRCLDDDDREKLDIPADRAHKAYRKLFNYNNKRLTIYTDDYKPSSAEKSDLKTMKKALRTLDRMDGGVDGQIGHFVNAAVRAFNKSPNRIPRKSQREGLLGSLERKQIKHLNRLWRLVKKYRTHENNGTFVSKLTGLLVNERKNEETDSGSLVTLYNKHNENHDVDLGGSGLKLTHKERRGLRQLVAAYDISSPTSSDRIYVKRSRQLMKEMKKDPRAARNIVQGKAGSRRQRKIMEEYQSIDDQDNNFLKTVVEGYAAGMDMDDISRAYIISNHTRAYNLEDNDQNRPTALDQQDRNNSYEELFMARLGDLNYDGKVDFDDKAGVKGLQLTKIFRSARSEMMQTVRRRQPDGSIAYGEGLTEQYAEKKIVYNILCFAAKMSERLGYHKMFGNEFAKIYAKPRDSQSMSAAASPGMASHAHEWTFSVFRDNPGILKFVQDVVTNSPLPLGFIMKHGGNAFERYHEETKESVARAAGMTHDQYERVNLIGNRKYEKLVNQYAGTDMESVVRSAEFREQFLNQLMVAVVEYGENGNGKNGITGNASAGGVGIGKAIQLAEGRDLGLSLGALHDGDEGQAMLGINVRRNFDMGRGRRGHVSAGAGARANSLTDNAFYPMISVGAAKELSTNEGAIQRSLASGVLKRTTFSVTGNAALFGTVGPYATLGVGLNRDRDKVGAVEVKYEALKKHLGTMSLDVIKALPTLRKTNVPIQQKIQKVQRIMRKSFGVVPEEAAANMLQVVMYFAPKKTLSPHEQQIAASMVADYYASFYKNEELKKIKSQGRYVSGFSVGVSAGVGMGEFGQGMIPLPRITLGAAMSFTKHKGLTMRDSGESLAQIDAALNTGRGNREIRHDCDDRALKFMNRTIQSAHKRYCESSSGYRYEMTRVNPPAITLHPSSNDHLVIPRRLRDGDGTSGGNFAGVRLSQMMKGHIQTDAQGNLIIHKSTPLRLVDVSGGDFASFVINVGPQPGVDKDDVTKMRNSTNDLMQLQAGRHDLQDLRNRDAADGKYDIFAGALSTELPDALPGYGMAMTVETISESSIVTEINELERHNPAFSHFFFNSADVTFTRTVGGVPSRVKIGVHHLPGGVSPSIDPSSSGRISYDPTTRKLEMPTSGEVVVTKKTDGSYVLKHIPHSSGPKQLTFTYHIEGATTEAITATTVKDNIQREIIAALPPASANNFPFDLARIRQVSSTIAMPLKPGMNISASTLPTGMTLSPLPTPGVLTIDQTHAAGQTLSIARDATGNYTLTATPNGTGELQFVYTEAGAVGPGGWREIAEVDYTSGRDTLFAFDPASPEGSIDLFFSSGNELALQELENVSGAMNPFLWMMYHAANIDARGGDGDIDTEELTSALSHLKTCLEAGETHGTGATKAASTALLLELNTLIDGSGNITAGNEFAAAYLIDRMKQVFAMEPGYRNHTIKDLFALRKKHFESLESPSGETNPLSRDDYESFFDGMRGFDAQYDVSEKEKKTNIIGYTAFYRKSGQASGTSNKYRRRSMTAPGGTTVYKDMIKEVSGGKETAVRDWFFKNLDVNQVEQDKMIASVKKTLQTKLSAIPGLSATDMSLLEGAVTFDNIKQLAETGEIVVGGYKIQMKSKMVAYLLGECANESVGLQIDGITIATNEGHNDPKKYMADVGGTEGGIKHSETANYHKEEGSCMEVIVNTPETRSEAYFAGRSDMSIGVAASFKPERKPRPPKRPRPTPDDDDSSNPDRPAPTPDDDDTGGSGEGETPGQTGGDSSGGRPDSPPEDNDSGGTDQSDGGSSGSGTGNSDGQGAQDSSGGRTGG